MKKDMENKVSEAFNSMLRTDYIALTDVDKLQLLEFYYVDQFRHLEQVLAQADQLIVGRRGTGKTTLFYRAFVECMASWAPSSPSSGLGKRTLGIYIDLSKCSSLSHEEAYTSFEHSFVTELCDAIRDQLQRFWPALTAKPKVLDRIFASKEMQQAAETKTALAELATLLQSGLPRVVSKVEQKVEQFGSSKVKQSDSLNVSLGLDKAEAGGSAENSTETEISTKQFFGLNSEHRLTVADVIRTLGALQTAAGISSVFIFVDEFSALSRDLQRRFCTLLRKILGSHAGIYVKLSAITDNYTLGSSIILQRDLFEVSLDLDAYIERNHGLTQAMEGLEEQADAILRRRLAAYGCPAVEDLFSEPKDILQALSREAMGVPRTLGIVLQQAWNNCKVHGNKIRRTDIEYGIRHASKAYVNQMLGSSRDGIAIPAHVAELWHALLDRAVKERSKEGRGASHFVVLPRHEEALKYLNMFFLLHLLTKGRTTKKDMSSRSLYSFDYGVCIENNLEYTTDKNVIRQQRFAYDDVVEPFTAKYYTEETEPSFRCPKCGKVYKESQLQVAGTILSFCPTDKTDLERLALVTAARDFTEEEVKIIGAIRSAGRGDALVARRIADDVGCYVQKVAKFGEKLEKQDLIDREKDGGLDKFIYFDAIPTR